MEVDRKFVVPTASRAKISRNLSYPIGAERVSALLVSAVQLADIKLHFYSGIDVQFRSGHYEFLRVEYLNNVRQVQEWPISTLYKRPTQSRWEIVVQPVPRTLRHRVKEYIVDFALTQIAHWLAQRAELAQQGNDILAFFYDEKTQEFVTRQLTRLEPLR